MKNKFIQFIVILLLISTVNALTAINSCGDLNTASEIYQVSQNISADVELCLNVIATNVTIDCQGYSINANNQTINYGVYSNSINTTVKNCQFRNFISNINSYAVYGTSSNLTAVNNTIFNSSFGIRGTNFTSITRNTFNLTNNTAISTQDNSTISSNLLYSTALYTGGAIFAVGDSTIFNNTISHSAEVSSSSTIISLSGNNSNISNNQIYNSTTYAIVADNGKNLTISNNNITIATYGISAANNNQSTITNNHVSNTSYSIYAGYGYQNNITGNLLAHTLYGIYDSNSYQNTFSNNNISDSLFGISTSAGYQDVIANNQINTTLYGIYYAGNYSNIYLNNLSTSNGMQLTGGNGTILYDNDFSASTSSISLAESTNLTVINTSFNPSTVSIGSGAQLYVQTPINITVFNYTGTLLTNAIYNLSINNTSLSNGNTGVNGFVLTNITTLHYNSSTTPINYTNTLLTGSKNTQSGITNVILNAGTLGTHQLVSVYMTQCETLSTPNTIRTLVTNESSMLNSTCFTITAINVAINCNGFYFISNGPNAQYSIYSNSTNTTVQNCGFKNFAQNTTSYSVYSTGDNLTITSNIFTNVAGGIYGSGIYSNITNNTLVGYTLSAIHLRGRNSTVYQNLIANNTDVNATGITITGNDTTIYNNTIFGHITSFSGLYEDLRPAILISQTNQVTTRNNVIDNTNYGIGAILNANITSFQDTHLNPFGYEYIVAGNISTTNYTGNITVLNSTFRANANGLFISAKGYIGVFQPVNITVYNNNALAAGANIIIKNKTQNQLNTVTTGGSGFALLNLSYAYITDDNVFQINTPHNFTYDNTSLIAYNRTEIQYQNTYFKITINTSTTRQCRVLSAANSNYILTKNETIDALTCFNVTAANVTLNCNGFTITTQNSDLQYSIASSAINTTVKNCIFNNLAQSTNSYSIYSNTSNLTIFNNTFYNISSGILSTALYTNITNNTFNLSTVAINVSSNDTITYNTLIDTTQGVTSIDYGTIYNNTIYGVIYAISIGISLTGNGANVSNNFLTSAQYPIYGNTNSNSSIIAHNSINATNFYYGITLSGNNNTIFNNTIYPGNSYFGIEATGNYSNVSYNTINAQNIGYGISTNGASGLPDTGGYFATTSYNTIYNTSNKAIYPGANSTSYNNNIFNATLNAFYVYYAHYAQIYNNQIHNSTNAINATYFDSSNYTTIYNNSISGLITGSSGIYSFQSLELNNFNTNFSNTTYPFYLTSNSTAYARNSTLNISTAYVENDSQLTIQTPLNLTLLDQTSNALEDVTVTITNGSTTLATGTSNTNGILLLNVTALLINGTDQTLNYSIATITGTKTGYSTNSTSINLLAGTSNAYQTASLMLTLSTTTPPTTSNGGSGGGSTWSNPTVNTTNTTHATKNNTITLPKNETNLNQKNEPTFTNINSTTTTENKTTDIPITPIAIVITFSLIVLTLLIYLKFIKKPN